MKYYFQLQYKMLNRQIIEFGLPPFFGYLLGSVAFVALSFFLFFKMPSYAAYIYGGLGLSVLTMLSGIERNGFLKSIFTDKFYSQVRLVENALVILPFVIFLLFKNNLWIALVVLVFSSVLAFFNTRQQWNYTIPTPFSKQPFEFVVGFRKTFYVFLGAYFLTYMAISVGNFNLGVFALLVIFFTYLSFYAEPEDPFFVWIFSMTSKQFIFKKIKTALLFSTLLSLPIIISLGIAFPNNIGVLFISQLLGYLYLLTILLAKYAAYPKQMNVPQAVIIGLGLWLPPLLLGIIPYFYRQSIKRLNNILA